MRSKRIRPMARERQLSFGEALELMRIDGHRLMLMHSNKRHRDDAAPEGKAYYVVPGGYITARDAKKIIARDDVMSCEDGLFPGMTQTWRMGA